MISIAILSGETITNYFLGQRTNSSPMLFAAAGIAATITGLVNWYVFKPKTIMNKQDAKLWVGILHTKLVVTLVLFTPIAQKFIPLDILQKVKFYTVIAMTVVAAFMRYFREAATEKKKMTK
jgi:Na+/H+-translocating membrane pyrophosphatase